MVYEDFAPAIFILRFVKSIVNIKSQKHIYLNGVKMLLIIL